MTETEVGKRKKEQMQHEDYWANCWEVPMCQYLGAHTVQASRPRHDPPDVHFHILHPDGRETSTWGEVTGAYYGPRDAEWLWADEPKGGFRDYDQPDESIAAAVIERVSKKLLKYSDLVKNRGKGNLLVVLNSPLTTRSTRVEAERGVLKSLSNKSFDAAPFQSIWLAYRLPETSLDEMENPPFVFADKCGEHVFFKCIAG